MSAVSVGVEGDTWEWHFAVVFPLFSSFLAAAAGCCCKLALLSLGLLLPWSTCVAQVGERGGILLHCTALTHPKKMEEKFNVLNFPFHFLKNFSLYTEHEYANERFFDENERKLLFSQFFEYYERFLHFITVC